MKIKYAVLAIACAGLLGGFAACGGDDDDDGGSNGGGTPCERLCPKAEELGCTTDCATECEAALTQVPAACDAELDALVGCLEGADDVECGTTAPLEAASCETESTAVFTCVLANLGGGGASGTGGVTGGGAPGTGGTTAAAGQGGAN